jgi:hypothetical protein
MILHGVNLHSLDAKAWPKATAPSARALIETMTFVEIMTFVI